MVKRKTIEVGKLLTMSNHFLAAKHTTADERETMSLFLESVLFETGNYMGYRYLDHAAYPDEVDGLGSRRYYYPSALVQDDAAVPLKDINKIRV